MPDEPRGTPPDEPKGTPPDEPKGTPKDKGKLYTAAEIDRIKSGSAAMGQGRAEKAATQEKEALKQELKTTTTRLDALEREIDETRLAEARGDPTQEKILRREQAVTKRERDTDSRERDLSGRETQLTSDLEALATDKGVISIAYLAAKHGLKTEELESLGISDPETLERVAEKLGAAKPKGKGEGEEEEGVEFEPDPGEGTGVSREPTQEQLEKMPMTKYAAYVQKRDKNL